REAGRDPFTNRVAADRRSLVSELRAAYAPALLEPAHELRYDPEKLSALAGDASHVVLGRLMGRRGFGKASFLDLRDRTGDLQLFAKKDVLGAAFDVLAELDLADHVEAEGRPMVTKKGELSLELTSLRLVTKALRPPPDTWHGLTDVDLRYRRRYVDMVANPEVAEVIAARAILLRGLRTFLDERGFLEVETPSLHSLIGGAAARPFETHHNALDLQLYLRIAPELYLKRLLVGGLARVFQAYATYMDLMSITAEMLRALDRALGQGMAQRGQSALYERWRAERPFTLGEPFARVPLAAGVEEALRKADLDPAEVLQSLER